MALITCTECGKEFSDKALSCPNCGCPTSEMYSNNIQQEKTNEVIQSDILEEESMSSKILSSVQNGVKNVIQKSKDAYRATKTVGPVQIDENHRVFRINGTVVKNGKKSGLGKTMLKGVAAVSTGGLSLLVPNGNKQKVGTKEWFEFNDLLSYELLEDDSIITSGGVGQALIGGALFGGVGAIVGGVTGKRVQKKRVESITITVTLNSFDVPCILIPLITKSTKTNSKEYQNAFTRANEILSILDVITHNK